MTALLIMKENNRANEIKTLALRIYTRLYHIYPLLYCKGNIPITSSHTIKNMEKNNKFIKMKHWIKYT